MKHFILGLVLTGCGMPGGTSLDAGGSDGAGGAPDASFGDAGPGTDAGAPVLATCPTSGSEAILSPGPCLVFTPAQSGASNSGANASVAQYALEPSAPAKGALIVHLNGSLGAPAGQIADPQLNLYNAASGAGFHVLGLAYRSTLIVGQACASNATCFGPTRKTIILGTYEPGATSSLANIREDEGIVYRLDAAIRLLASARPNGGWGQFLANPAAADPAQRLAWNKIIGSGHSQGGGHAAYLGKLFSLRQVVQLSSTCDAVGGTPAPWTLAASAWATSPATRFVGFAAPTIFSSSVPSGGDTLCPYHLAVWQNMGMDVSRQHDDAATCGGSGNTHDKSIGCVDNFTRWGTLFQ